MSVAVVTCVGLPLSDLQNLFQLLYESKNVGQRALCAEHLFRAAMCYLEPPDRENASRSTVIWMSYKLLKIQLADGKFNPVTYAHFLRDEGQSSA
jgi:hypothetical protein